MDDLIFLMVSSRERSHIPPCEKENHLQTYLGWGYVSSQESSCFGCQLTIVIFPWMDSWKVFPHSWCKTSASTKKSLSKHGLFHPILSSLAHVEHVVFFAHTSTGRKFALVEGLSHDLESVPDRFFMSILRGRCGTVKLSPGFEFNKLRRYSRGEI